MQGNPIRGDRPGSFAWTVLARRHPVLLDQIRDAHPYGPGQWARLDALQAEAASGPITPLPPDAADAGQWRAWGASGGAAEGADCFGRSWFDVPFLWAENYFYRRVLDAVDFYRPGPWTGLDPFGPVKAAELSDVAAASLPEPGPDAGHELLLASVWGNRADLGFRAGGPVGAAGTGAAGDHGDPSASSPLIVDHSARFWHRLAGGGPGRVVVVADNAGRELLADLLLIDHLLTSSAAEQISLHLKPAPYFVSDATTADLSGCLRALSGAGPALAAAARRLREATRTGAITVATHGFYCAPLHYHELPDDLAQEYAGARLVVLKGDLNYRRLTGDTDQPATTSFDSATEYFPAPVAVLRTLKCDVVVGLDARTVTDLDAEDPSWRTNGTHALIQVRG